MMELEAMLAAVMSLLGLAIVLVFIRLVRGPSLPDRVVAFELLASLGIGLIAVYAIVTNQPAFLDVAVILALVSFLGTVAFAYYMERRATRQ
jgi:multicomponent Na+:H+ antiporter subunit F